jgi:hypothetical protein
MNRMFLAGAATALTMCAAAWGALQYTQPAKAAADGTQGMAMMSAVVRSDGTLARGAGALSSVRRTEGYYEIIFDRNIRNCTMSALIGPDTYPGHYPVTLVSGQFTDNSSAYRVAVLRPNDVFVDSPFHLLAFCHK